MAQIVALVVAVVAAILWVLNVAGTLQTAKDLIDQRGPIVKTIGAVLLSPLFQIAVFAAGVLVLVAMHFRWLDIFKAPKPKVELSILTLVIINGASSRPVLQMTVRVRNTGAATTLDNWRLALNWRDRSLNSGTHLSGHPAAKGSKDLPALEERVSATPLQGTIDGLLFFTSPVSGPELLEAIKKRDRALLLRVSATDNTDRDWFGQRSVAELADEEEGTSKGTQPVRR